MKKINKTFYFLASTIILLLLYIFSFFLSSTNDKRKALKSAYVNPKYENQINKIELQKGNECLILTKQNGKWFTAQKENAIFIPADSSRIEKFIKELIKVRNMYKISDKITKDNAFGFDDSQFCVKYQTESTVFPALYFGKTDFSQVSRYFMSEKYAAVYESDVFLDVYLTTSIQNWCEPFIISNEVTGIKAENIQSISVFYDGKKYLKDSSSQDFLSNCQKLLELRHGGSYIEDEESVNQDFEAEKLEFILYFGNKTSASFTITQVSESSFKVACHYDFERTSSFIDYQLKISLWTYNKIKEIIL